MTFSDKFLQALQGFERQQAASAELPTCVKVSSVNADTPHNLKTRSLFSLWIHSTNIVSSSNKTPQRESCVSDEGSTHNASHPGTFPKLLQ